MIYQSQAQIFIVGAVNLAGMVFAAFGWQAVRCRKALVAVALGVGVVACLVTGMILPIFLTINL